MQLRPRLHTQLLAGLSAAGALFLSGAEVRSEPGPVEVGLVEPPAAEAPAEPSAAAALAVEVDTGGCPAAVSELPAGRYVATDRRLKGQALVVVFKEDRRVGRYQGGALAREPDGGPSCWPIALGVGDTGEYPPGHKVRQGDRRTPEGWYRTSDKPWSQFYGAVAVHYPNGADADRGLAAGLIDEAQHAAIIEALARGAKPPQDTRLGGEILIHGGGSSADWTLGCVALDNDDLDGLRAELPKGMRTDVLILP